MIRHQNCQEPYRWDGIDVHPYKEDGTLFKSVSRQTIFHGTGDLDVELRYFEVGPGGHSTLERHEHQHAVMIIRGKGEVFVGGEITPLNERDFVHIPPMTWHQFRANRDDFLGFLCVVSVDRDRPQRPTEEDRATLIQYPGAEEFLRF